MSLKNFENLRDLTNSLSGEELNLAKKHLVAFESYNTTGPSKMLQLFKNILKNPNISFESSKRTVGSDITLKSYNQLVKRTLILICASSAANLSSSCTLQASYSSP